MGSEANRSIVQYWPKVVTNSEIQILKEFLEQDDQWMDDRGDVRNKLMTPDLNEWPISTVHDILDRILPGPYEIENADFVEMNIYSRLHTDTADGDQKRLFKNVIIPLEVNGHASTAVFPHRWHGSKAKFTRVDLSPWRYPILDVQGLYQEVQDIRDLFNALCNTSKPQIEHSGHWFVNDQDRKQYLHDLIIKRSSVDSRISDYSGIEGVHDQEFPEDFRVKWLAHLPRETLRGLDVPEIAEWHIGNAITFDRQYLHSGTSQLSGSKSFLAVFTYHPI
jgi:hypothetical protein